MNKDTFAKIIADLINMGKVFRCPTCKRLFGSAEWLRQHQCRAKAAKDVPQPAPRRGFLDS